MGTYHIAVAGCGPCGLAAALLLARAGHQVTLFERFEQPAPIGSGLMIQPTGLAVLEQLGLASRILREGARIDRLFGVAGTRTVLDVRYAALRRPDSFGIGIHRAGLFGALYEAVLDESIALRTGRTITGSHEEAGKRVLRFADGNESEPFDLVVDALGTRSTLAPEVGRELAYGALWATLDWPKSGSFEPHALSQRYRRSSVMAGILPIGPGQNGRLRAAFFWSLRADRHAQWRAAGLEAWKADVLALWPACAPLLDQIGEADQLTFARYAHRTLHRPVEPALVHIGDAWHSASPQLGQGANMALLDAWALARGLSEAGDVPGGLAAAAAMRRRHVAIYQALTWLFTPVYQSDSTVLPLVRDRLVGPVSKLWPATTIQAAMVSGLVGAPLERLGLAQQAWPRRSAARWARGHPLLVSLVALLTAVWLVLFAGLASFLKAPVERQLGVALGREVSIAGKLRVVLTPFSVTLVADRLTVGNPEWASRPHLLSARRAEARFSAGSLLTGQPALRSLYLRGGTIELERSADGRRNTWSFPARNRVADLTLVRRLRADDITVRYRDPARAAVAEVALEQRTHRDLHAAGWLRFGTEKLTVGGSLRPGSGGAVLALGFAAPGFSARLEGAASGPLAFRARDLTLTAAGEDLAVPLRLLGIDAAGLPPFRVAGRPVAGRSGWYLRELRGQVGATDIAGEIRLIRRTPRVAITARLASETLELADAAKLLGLRTGPPDAATATNFPSLPDAELSPAALGRFDLDLTYSAKRIVGTSLAVSALSTRLSLQRGLLRLAPLNAEIEGGALLSDVAVDARRSPALAQVDLRLLPTPMAKLLPRWGVSGDATTAALQGRVQLAGRGATLHEALSGGDGRMALVIPKGSVRVAPVSASPLDLANLRAAMFGAQGEPAQVNCGIIAFNIAGGIGRSDPILIDTSRSVLTGSGQIDLHNGELDVKLTPGAKQFTLFSGRSSVRVGGTLADPQVTPQKQPWLRRTSILGLQLSVPNFGAIFDFVDPGKPAPLSCEAIRPGGIIVPRPSRGHTVRETP